MSGVPGFARVAGALKKSKEQAAKEFIRITKGMEP
jgi:hypothetical protein